jgi:GntP family gluconate:H+ symporter
MHGAPEKRAATTAQGSSTVSLITTSTIVYPLLATLGMASPMGAVQATMAVGCGSMVVSQFSGIPVDTAYKTQTLATLVQGIVGMVTVWILSLILV